MAGNVHWAYVTDQTNRSNPSWPLILDSYKPGTREFDEDLWGRKVIVLCIDSSVRALPMDPADGRVLDHTGHDILSPEANAWERTGEIVPMLLRQPEPR